MKERGRYPRSASGFDDGVAVPASVGIGLGVGVLVAVGIP
jgi:hypothetical protein